MQQTSRHVEILRPEWSRGQNFDLGLEDLVSVNNTANKHGNLCWNYWCIKI